MIPGEFELYPDAIGRVLNETPAVRKLEELAAQIVRNAQQEPRGSHGGPHQVDLMAVGESRTTPDGAEVDIDWPSHVWHIIEFGSINNQAYRPITRAAMNAGLRLIDKR